MAENDGSWDHAKGHKAQNNHEVLTHVKSFSPPDIVHLAAADNTRVKKVVTAKDDANTASNDAKDGQRMQQKGLDPNNGFLGSNLDLYIMGSGKESRANASKAAADKADSVNKQKSDSVRKSLNIK